MYAVVGWLLVQIATQVFPFFEIPNWGVRLVVLAIIIGFPIALVLAWAFELTPEGLNEPKQRRLSRESTPTTEPGFILHSSVWRFLWDYSFSVAIPPGTLPRLDLMAVWPGLKWLR